MWQTFQGTERLNNLAKIIQLVSVRAKIQSDQQFDSEVCFYLLSYFGVI